MTEPTVIKKHGGGRPTKLSPELRDEIGRYVGSLRLVFGIELKVHERVAMRIGHRVHGAADAAIAAIGAAARDELLTAETE